ncbi:gliding motility protein GldM [Flavobacterium sp. SUN052]|uniref:type IX secretion system motor protein PorM/GldM n=1 Tax=Flavobacterium sp. SUN052 TaxID=3002441 RepID=UPI00237EC25E|nr:gliding motility protein GldM [Flavobacterium sp. SUN052]MEC4003036.1 gliding motility protein GldM [Flavobacterium sp. SUN052]
MAGGKLTPRQKMINLMYLVFIAMLALNMSKEVLSAFGLMNEKFDSANIASGTNNKQMLESLDKKAEESKGEFIVAAATAHKVEKISKTFYDFVESLKADAKEGVEVDEKTGKLPYEAMDKGPHIDEKWFQGDNYSAKGNSIVAAMNKYVSDIKVATAGQSKLAGIVKEVESKFNTNDITDGEGVKKKYLSYHFEHFPAIASLAKLTAWQNDIRKAEADVYSTALGKAAVDESSYSKFEAIVVLDKNAYFQGEKVTGKVVLGKYDPNAQFSGFQGPGRLENGQAIISTTAGAVGEQNLAGSFNFMENGKPIKLPFKGTYVVVPRPKTATISADKMNVVYRGVVNPITVSFAGVSDNNVTASAPGLVRSSAPGKYNMSPGSGTEIVINVNAKMPDGTSANDKRTFRIKNIPAPVGAIGGTVGITKGAKSRLASSQVSAKLLDFDFDVNLKVTQFTFKVPGQAAVIVSGDRVNAQCIAAMAKATRGDQVTISEIKTKVEGSTIMLPQTAPVIFEIL